MKYKGGSIYFCCKSCREEFSQNLAMHSAKANHQLFKTGQAKVEKEKDVEKKVELVFNNIVFSKHYAISVNSQ